jgi:hypothetical protein
MADLRVDHADWLLPSTARGGSCATAPRWPVA